MSKIFRTLMAFCLLAACSGGPSISPRTMDNACSILRQNPSFQRAFRATERRWGVPVHVQMAVIHQESKFEARARTPYRFYAGVIPMGRQSSAFGYAQALDGTWDEYRKDTGSRLARRDRIRDASDFMGWYINTSRQRNNIPLSDARNQYLAYHEGHTGYARGSYRNKRWLMNVASKVDARSKMYARQLKSCGRA